MSAPIVPQRPARTQDFNITSAAPVDAPVIPPRPARRMERSVSPTREAFTRSPLNGSPFDQKPSMNGFLQNKDRGNGISLHGRTPSVTQLPLIGQEGMEYASLDDESSPEEPTKTIGQPTHTRNIAGDLPLHAPKASVAPMAARNQIATVTRTDSSQAAVAGIGRPSSDYDERDTSSRRLSFPKSGEHRMSANYSPDISRSASRPASVTGRDHEQGIPEIGLQVPMYPNAGDVQAPSPAPSAPLSTGVGFFNNTSRTSLSQGSRRKSAQGFHAPPGSYGMHGHGVQQLDTFEKTWYQRHPEELAKEKEGAYGPGLGQIRGEWAMSSEELNKLVRETSNRGLGFGTSPAAIGTPSEDIGFMATEEYTSRMASPRVGALHLVKSHSRSHSGTQPQVNSPLRKASTPLDVDSHAMDSELDEDTIDLDPPAHKQSKIHGGGYDPPTADLGPRGGNTEELGGWIDERGRGTPILASDEVAKNPAAEYLHPAISPELDKRGDDTYYASNDPNAPYQSGEREGSTSRPRSMRLQDVQQRTGTPLEDVVEYEPLFDDEEDDKASAMTAAERFKRPNMERHRFPSQDIWEDTPTSLQFTTTVTGPQESEALQSPVDANKPATATFESPEKEAARKGEITEDERLSFLTDPSKGYAKPKFSTAVQHDMSRPGLRHRFPSQDIWEDTPDSLRLETTIEPDNTSDTTSPTVRSPTTSEKTAPMNSLAQSMEAVDPALTAQQAKPSIPPRPARNHASDAPQAPPSIPARPPRMRAAEPSQSAPAERKAPEMPERPRPQVPPRPARLPQEHPVEPTPTLITTKMTSAGSSEDIASTDKLATSPTKSKPAIPSKPAATGKFAALKAGFMNDLNSRLQMGPQAPPKPQPPPEAEADEDKAPLADARKGRARGPARRKPAEAAEASAPSTKAGLRLNFFEPSHMWSIDPATPESIRVGQQQSPTPPSTTKTAAQLSEQPNVSPLARNTAGESLHRPGDEETPQTSTGALAHAGSEAMDARARADEAGKQAELAPFIQASIGHSGDVPEPVVAQPVPELAGVGAGDQAPPPMGANNVMGADGLKHALEDSTLETAPTPQDEEPLLAEKHTDLTAASRDADGGADAGAVGVPSTTQITAGAPVDEAMPGGFPTGTREEAGVAVSGQDGVA